MRQRPTGKEGSVVYGALPGWTIPVPCMHRFACRALQVFHDEACRGRTERMRVNPVRSSSGLRASSSTFSNVVNSRVLNSTLASPICSTCGASPHESLFRNGQLSSFHALSGILLCQEAIGRSDLHGIQSHQNFASESTRKSELTMFSYFRVTEQYNVPWKGRQCFSLPRKDTCQLN